MDYPLLITPLTVAVVMAAGAVAGGLGALLGLGGGVFLVPFLNSVIGLPIKIAVAISLMTVIATSSVVSVGTVGRNLINLRLGMLLEVASAAGGVAAGLTFHALSDETLFLWFALVTGVIAVMMLSRLDRRNVILDRDGRSRAGSVAAYFDDESGANVVYRVKRLPVALGVSRDRRYRVGLARDRRRHPEGAAAECVVRRSAAGRRRDERPDDRRHRRRLGPDPVRQPLHSTAARRRCRARRAGRLARRTVVWWPREGALAQAAARGRAHARVARPLREAAMTPPPDALARLEAHVGRLFVAGVSVSAAMLAAGLVLFLFAPDAPAASKLLNAGLLVLMATPMLRVLLSVVEYVRMGDWFFVSTTLAVIAELSVTVWSALRLRG